jgi:glycosyltransferase involved in cell wall biosynthesis
MAQPIIMEWPISSFFGWGMYGLNLALNWAGDPTIEPICAGAIDLRQIALDRLRVRSIEPFLERSLKFQARLQQHKGGAVTANAPVLVSLGNGLYVTATAQNVVLAGQPTIGVAFFEESLDAQAIERGGQLSLIVTGSTWNEQVLRACGLDRVRTVFQGIDPTQFHRAPKLGVMRDRFLIFSGGKVELRKGQDIVLAAFKVFAKRHPEATLVTAWHSPWPQLARSLDQSGIAAPIVFDKDGKVDVRGWVEANEIAPDRVIDLGNVPNIMMPSVLREMDAAVFTNRAEGGTNLVAMECMASGIPVILSRNTGHLDLIEEDNCYPLLDQRAVAGRWNSIGDVKCWGESQVDEVVERLEQIFAERVEAERRGRRGAVTMQRFTWADTAQAMKQVVLGAVEDSVRAAA